MRIKFFITPVYPYGNDHYYHEIIALAEGFLELGHKVFGNADYWWQPESGSYLINGDVDNNEFDIAVYDYRYVKSFEHLLFRKNYPNFDKSKKHILIDRNDWIQPIWYNNQNYNVFDLIFSGNIYQTVEYASNVRPWTIGLTKRIINTIDTYYSENNLREEVTGYNFRVDHNMRGFVLTKLKHTLKKYPSVEKFTKPEFNNENDRFYYLKSSKRHNPEYYKILCKTLFFMSYGGYYDFKPLKYQPYGWFDKILRKPAYWKYLAIKKSDKDFSDCVFIFQHDNFRFWEVLYSGSIAINLDLEYWKFKLPVMPESGKHYIGIKQLSCDNLENEIDKITKEKLKEISLNAREWVLKNYSPKAQAQRVIDELSRKKH